MTTRIRTLIVDDEPLARSTLSILLRKDPEIEIVGQCGSGGEALESIREAKPDLLFLDVQMPECDGFDVLEQLGQDLPAAIVFVTAYDQYALRAFEAGALDYLLKPFDDARFQRTLERAKQKIRLEKHQPEKPARIAVRSAGEIAFLNTSQIDWVEAADYYVCLHVGLRTHLLRRSMAELDRNLDRAVFCRIHRSTIVNLDRVRALNLNVDGDHDVLLNDGTRLRMSRKYRRELQTRLGLRVPKQS